MERNWKYFKYEIDVIAQKHNEICFIEVKTRAINAPIKANKALSLNQEKRIITAANHYLQKFEIDLSPRFDLIAITRQGNNLTLEHMKNTFFPTLD